MNGFSLSSASRVLSVIAVALVATACASTGAVPRPFPMPPRTSTTAPTTAPPATASTPNESAPGVDATAATGNATVPLSVATDTANAIPTELPLGVIDTALALLGSPYRNGGSTPEGFDCSGFTQWVFARHGVVLPRESRQQYEHGNEIDGDAIAAGDLVFFTTVAPGASHVAIALDDDRFVHAPNARGVVRIERRSSAYWRRRFIGARRVSAN